MSAEPADGVVLLLDNRRWRAAPAMSHLRRHCRFLRIQMVPAALLIFATG